MEKITYETSGIEPTQEKVVDVVAQECSSLGYTISCTEAVVRRVVEAASAITMSALDVRRKWMIDSRCAMDVISRKELSAQEIDLAEQVRRIKFNTASGSTASEMAISFDIKGLSECALVRVLDSTPVVLSTGVRCMKLGYNFRWP